MLGVKGQGCTHSGVGAAASQCHWALTPSCPQRYMRKQVTPLFNYYKNITNNWKDIPSGLMVQ